MNGDLRHKELMELCLETGRPLALSPVAITAMEDAGLIVHPFTGESWIDPDGPLALSPVAVSRVREKPE